MSMHNNQEATAPNGARVNLTCNCTLEAYAKAKHLPLDFLRELDLETVRNPYDAQCWAMPIPYRNADGTIHRFRLRTGLFKAKDGRDERMRWDKQAEGHGIILYGLDQLRERKGQVFLVEGESDTHTLWWHGYAALGLPGASNYNPDRDDPHLDGRDIVVLLEGDEGGKALLRQLSLSTLRARIQVAVLDGVKDVSELHIASPGSFREKLDQAIGQAVPLEKYLQEQPELDKEVIKKKPRLAAGFRYKDCGSVEYFVSVDGDGNTVWSWLCSPIEILADTRDGEQKAWGRLLRIRTRDGHWHRWAMPMKLLAGSGEELRSTLLSLGLIIASGAKARGAMQRLLDSAAPQARALSVSKVGWQGRTFVLPDEAIGERRDELVVFQPAVPIKHNYRMQGTLENWQSEVAAYAVGNSRIALALSAAFAGPLLQLVGTEGGGLHFRGSSSTGKTTALQVAASVWGGGGLNGYVRRWRTTDSALEGISVAHCDTLLALDEIAEVNAEVARQVAYMLANGQGRARANKSGDALPMAEWRVLFLSTGEISLADKIAEEGRGPRRVTAGQQVRIVDLPADAGAGLGMFEDLHEFERPSELADHLINASAQHFGKASRAFLERLTKDLEAGGETARALMAEWLKQHCPSKADGQVRRVARRFALIAAAGDMATNWGILPWPSGEAACAGKRCLNDWLAQRGGLEPAEVRQAIAGLQAFIGRHSVSRFASWDDADSPIANRAGFRRAGTTGTSYYFFPDAFREACGVLSGGMVARVLAQRGVLEKGSDGKPQKGVRLPNGEGNQRMYIVTPKLFEDADDD